MKREFDEKQMNLLPRWCQDDEFHEESVLGLWFIVSKAIITPSLRC